MKETALVNALRQFESMVLDERRLSTISYLWNQRESRGGKHFFLLLQTIGEFKVVVEERKKNEREKKIFFSFFFFLLLLLFLFSLSLFKKNKKLFSLSQKDKKRGGPKSSCSLSRTEPRAHFQEQKFKKNSLKDMRKKKKRNTKRLHPKK